MDILVIAGIINTNKSHQTDLTDARRLKRSAMNQALAIDLRIATISAVGLVLLAEYYIKQY